MNLKEVNRNNENVASDLSQSILERFSSQEDPVLIAVGGPGGTGKSAFSRLLERGLVDAKILRLDDYKTSRKFRKEKGVFGPHPEANEIELLAEHLKSIKLGNSIEQPIYCSSEGKANSYETYHPARFNILDGEISTYSKFRPFVDFSIYIDAELETQLTTRLTRDVKKRGHSQEKAMQTFWGSNIEEFSKYGFDTQEWVDIILYCHSDYSVTIHKN